MAFRTLTELQGTTQPIDADTSQPAGHPDADCRFVDNGEDATAEIMNRPHYALAENTDYLKGIQDTLVSDVSDADTALDDPKAYPEIKTFTSGVSQGTVTLTGGDIPMYVGGGGYSDTQEFRDILVQITDASGNEILDSNGAEIKCSAIERNDTSVDIIGQGFWSSTDVDIIFSSNLPDSTSLRLVYSKQSDLRNLPADALIAVNIRGAHEAPAEANFKAMYVVAPDTVRGPADFVGSDAVQRALDSLGNGAVLFIRRGTYSVQDVSSGGLDITQHNITIIGEGSDDATGDRVDFEIDTGSSHDLEVSGNNVVIRGVRFAGSGAAGRNVILSSSDTVLYNCEFSNVGLKLSGAYRARVLNCNVSTDASALILTSTSHHTFESCGFVSLSTAGTEPLALIGESAVASNCVWNSCQFIVSGSTTSRDCLDLTQGQDLVFNSCTFQATSGRSFTYGDATELNSARFAGCTFTNAPSTAGGAGYGPIIPRVVDTAYSVRLTFDTCQVYTSGTWYSGPFTQLIAKNAADYPSTTMEGEHGFIQLNNCYFKDGFCKGSDAAVDPPSQEADPTNFPVILLEGVIGNGVVLDRTNATYDLQGSAWIRFYRSQVSNVRVAYPDVVTNGCFDLDSNVSPVNALIEVFSSKVKDMQIIGWMGSGTHTAGREWARPLLYIKSDISVADRSSKGEVDGFEIVQLLDTTNPYDWEITTTTLIYMYEGIIRRFRWDSRSDQPSRNTLSAGEVLDSLISVSQYCEVERAKIYHDTSGKKLSKFIDSSGSDKGTIVQDCHFDVDDPGNAAIGFESAVSYGGEIVTGNRIEVTGGSSPSDSILKVGANGRAIGNEVIFDDTAPSVACIYAANYSIVSNNYVQDSHSSGDYDSIEVVASTPNCVVIGNILRGGGGNAPDISDSGVIGYLNNLRSA